MAVHVHFEIDVGDLPAKFELLALRMENYKTYEMPTQLVEWQEQDMHRKFPNIEIGSGMLSGMGATTGGIISFSGVEATVNWVLTRIWPRSRLSKTGKLVASRVKQRTRFSVRPILRQQLFWKLRDRMWDLLRQQITWP